MRGTTPRRERGMADPVLASMVRATGVKNTRHYLAATPKIQAYRDRWVELAPFRDGPVNPQRFEVNDPAEMTKQIKFKATDLGADMVGVCRLQPHMIDLGADVPHEFVMLSLFAPARRILSSVRRCVPVQREISSGDVQSVHEGTQQVGYKTPKSW
jgi:hypothetical protein